VQRHFIGRGMANRGGGGGETVVGGGSPIKLLVTQRGGDKVAD
jgi:hypothetical protein